MTKKDVIAKIINQANSLNKKIKSFKSEGITDHYDFITAMFNSDQMKYVKGSGALTKSKKFFEKQNILQLQKTLNTITKINNHDVFGTLNKYNNFKTESWQTLVDTVKNHLTGKGYSESDVMMIITSRNFNNSLYMAFKDVQKGYGSLQVIEKVYLQYAQGTITEEEIAKATSDIEHSVTRQNELIEDIRLFEEYKRGRR